MTTILAITLYYPPHHLGGYEIACQTALRGMADRGHDVHVLTSDMRLSGAGADHPDIEVTRSLRCYVDGSTLVTPGLADRLRIERHNQRELSRLIDELDPDVISVWHMGAMSLGLLTTIEERSLPAVAVIADDWLVYGVNLDPWTRLFERGGRTAALRRAIGRVLRPVVGVPTVLGDFGANTAFLFTSADNRSRAESGGHWRFPRAAISYLGIDLAAFDIADDDRASREPTLLYAGRCDPRKGIGTAIAALPDLPGVTLEIRAPDADNDHADELRANAERLGVQDRVRFEPSLPQHLLAQRMASVSAVVFPSEWPEPFGLVPLEAMACETAVIATGVGGSGEFLVDGRNCAIFTPGDPASLAVQARRVLEDEPFRRRLVQGGSKTARFFSDDEFTDVVERWHEAAAGGFRGPLPEGRHFAADLLDRTD